MNLESMLLKAAGISGAKNLDKEIMSSSLFSDHFKATILNESEITDNTEMSVLLGSETQQSIVIPDYLIHDSEIVGYPDIDFQQQIYLWAISDILIAGRSVLDVGAGRGDLFHFLGSVGTYCGYDTNKILTEIGPTKYPDARFSLINEDYLKVTHPQKFDISVCIGTLNSDELKSSFKEFFDKMYEDTKEVLVFILSTEYFPFSDIFMNILTDENIPFKVDYSKFEGIYKLSVYK